MKRTKLKDRQLPDYTKGEEIFNMVSHIVGGAFGIIALIACVVVSALKGSIWGVVSGIIYGVSLILLYTMSSIYHGLRPNMGKKVLQVLDHCTIYFLIAGTYTPVALCAIRPLFPLWGWLIFGFVWGVSAVAAVFTAIDLKKYATFSMICYLLMGWAIVVRIDLIYRLITPAGFWLLLAGGLAYTVGAGLYLVGKKRRYAHTAFHMFTVIGSLLHFLCILLYVI